MDITNFGQSNNVNQVLPTGIGLDTIRALHQTVVSLRAALENSQLELSRLREKIKDRVEYRDAIEKLAIENHILRRKIIANDQQYQPTISSDDEIIKIDRICMESTQKFEQHSDSSLKSSPRDDISKRVVESELSIPIIELSESEQSNVELTPKPDDFQISSKSTNLDIDKDLENLSLKSLSEGDNSVFSDLDVPAGNKTAESENESEEVDDIELIFTTDETKEIGTFQEDLVSISETEKWRKDSNSDTPVLLNFKTAEFDSGDVNGGAGENENSDDDVFITDKSNEKEGTKKKQYRLEPSEIEVRKQKSIESTDSCADSSFENRSFEKDESFDQFDEREKRLQKMWSQCSVLVETDISKCGVLDDSELPNLANRRYTCPNPLAYRPIIHRDSISKASNRSYSSRYTIRSPRNTSGYGQSAIRPILNERCTVKTESEAQTDISALPSPWKSESYLAHKVSHNFTTLPSKFALPVYHQPKMRLSEKTQEARRILLSDINFTSMVPELSRSADHLCQDGVENLPPQYETYTRGPFLRTPEVTRKYDLTDSLTSPNFGKYYSPSDYSNFGSSRFDSSNQYVNKYRGSLTSMTSPSQYEMGRSNYWRQNCTSFDNSRTMSYSSRPTFGSVPTSPTRHHRSRSVPHVQRSSESGFSTVAGSRYNFTRSYSRPTSQWGFGQRSKTRSRVTFEDTNLQNLRYSSRTNQSLPDLRSDSYDSGGDSTDSLVEEAEHFLRRSIDCMASGTPAATSDWKSERPRTRRASAPDPVRETDPPTGSTPYLPRIPRDLRSGHWVKVIGPEGRVRGGRVRHVGPIAEAAFSQNLPIDTAFVGVELVTPTGNSDGSYQGKRFFDCETDHAIFVPFKKVIMAWST